MTVGYQLTIKLGGEEVLQRRIATAKTQVTDFGPLWSRVLKWFIEMELLQFAAEGYGRWPQLAASTVKRRGSAHPILEVTGALKRSLTNAGKGWYQVRTPNSIELGSSLMVGGWNLGLLHQRGTGAAHSNVGKSGKATKKSHVTFRMPPRPPIDPLWKEKSSLRLLFAQFIHDVVTGHSTGSGSETV